MNRFYHHRRTSTILTTLSGLALGLTVAGSFAISEALAGDVKTYAGNQCLPLDAAPNNTTVNYTTGIAVTPLSLKNTSTADRDVLCPVLRDDPTDDIDGVEVSIFNRVDATPPEDTQCCLIAFEFDGSATIQVCERADPPAGRQVLSFEGPELGNVFDYGYYTLKCALETNEEVFGYVLDED